MLEYDLSKSISKADETSRQLDQRSQELKAKEALLLEAEAELSRNKSH